MPRFRTALPARPRLPHPALPSAGLLRVELLSGLVAALALIPEAISFSIIAGVFQVMLGWAGVAQLMRFVPRSVMTGFVNALAILIFLAQVPHLREGGALGWVLVAAGLAIIVLWPRLTRAVPAPLVAIVALTVLVVVAGITVPDVGGEGALPDALPVLGIPAVPFTLHTLAIVAPYSFTLAVVGLLESLMTAKLVDDITETSSDKHREVRGQGIANVVTGLFGGMAGCAMIGQTMINVRVGGARTRLSTFAAGALLLTLASGSAASSRSSRWPLWWR